jgi:trk system potassium uptake protein TrkH
VTGLVVVDTGTAYTIFGKTVIALLIQTGGLGVATLGIAVTLIVSKRMTYKDSLLIKDSLNTENLGNVNWLTKRVLIITFCVEAAGALLSLTVFCKDYPFLEALGISVFHSVSSFNNAGFDLLGGMRSLTGYAHNVPLNLITCALIVCGGLGYLVILDVTKNKRFKKLSLQSKIVLCVTGSLILGGTLLLLITDDIDLLGALFQSVTARTAGFNTYDLTAFSVAGQLVLCCLMFIGASPGSTGGGIKTTTFFSLLVASKAASTGGKLQAFRRKIPADVVSRAFVVVFLSASLVFVSTLLLCIFEPEHSFMQLFFEEISAFATVGLSIATTPTLGSAARIILIISMFIGRVGPLTIATIWIYRPQSLYSYTEEGYTIG